MNPATLEEILQPLKEFLRKSHREHVRWMSLPSHKLVFILTRTAHLELNQPPMGGSNRKRQRITKMSLKTAACSVSSDGSCSVQLSIGTCCRYSPVIKWKL